MRLRMSVVLPEPRKPVMIVIGVGGMVWCAAAFRTWKLKGAVLDKIRCRVPGLSD